MIVVLSGPKTAETQARNALVSAGHHVRPTKHDHGLTPTVTGKKVRQAVSFLTVEDAADVDAVTASVKSLKFVLRQHYEPAPPPPPSPRDEILAEIRSLRADVDALKGGAGLTVNIEDLSSTSAAEIVRKVGWCMKGGGPA